MNAPPLSVAAVLVVACSGAPAAAQQRPEYSDVTRIRVTTPTLVDFPAGSPRWSPDGQKLLYVKKVGVYSFQLTLWSATPRGASSRPLIPPANRVTGVTWSPDGLRVAYVYPGPSKYVLAVYDLGTGLSIDVANVALALAGSRAAARTKWVGDTLLRLYLYTSLAEPVVRGLDLNDLNEAELGSDETTIERLSYYNLADESIQYGLDLDILFSTLPGTREWVRARARSIAEGDAQRHEGARAGTSAFKRTYRFWVGTKDNLLAVQLLPRVYEAEVSPSLSQVAFVREDSLYVASLTHDGTPSPLTWTIPFGSSRGLVPGDIVPVYAPRINPLNNRILGADTKQLRANTLVTSVTPESSVLHVHIVYKQPTDGDIAAVTPDLWAPITQATATGGDTLPRPRR